VGSEKDDLPLIRKNGGRGLMQTERAYIAQGIKLEGNVEHAQDP
jgi:hypothetical protein